MADDNLDPEILAAFLDGTLPPERRAAVLRLITRSPDAYELFAETAGAAAELRRHPFGDEEPDEAVEENGGTDTPSPVEVPAAARTEVPLPHVAQVPARRRLRRASRWVPLAAAATVTALAVVARFGAGPPASPVLGLIAASEVVRTTGAGSVGNSLGVAWEDHDWSVLRGTSMALPNDARAFRIGVRLVDFELSVSVRDPDAARVQARDLANLLAEVDAGAPIASRYARWQRSIDASEPPPPDARAHAAASIRELLGESVWLDLGIWAEQARLAAIAERASFFAGSGRPARELARIATAVRAAGARPTSIAISKVEQAMPRGSTTDVPLAPVRSALDALFRASGG